MNYPSSSRKFLDHCGTTHESVTGQNSYYLGVWVDCEVWLWMARWHQTRVVTVISSYSPTTNLWGFTLLQGSIDAQILDYILSTRIKIGRFMNESQTKRTAATFHLSISNSERTTPIPKTKRISAQRTAPRWATLREIHNWTFYTLTTETTAALGKC